MFELNQQKRWESQAFRWDAFRFPGPFVKFGCLIIIIRVWIIVHEILISNRSDIQITRPIRFTLCREHWKKSKRRLGTVNVDQWCDLTGFVKLREASLPWEKFLEHGQACQTTSGSMCLVNITVHSIKYHQHASVEDLRYIPFSKCVIFIYIFTYVLRSHPQYS